LYGVLGLVGKHGFGIDEEEFVIFVVYRASSVLKEEDCPENLFGIPFGGWRAMDGCGEG